VAAVELPSVTKAGGPSRRTRRLTAQAEDGVKEGWFVEPHADNDWSIWRFDGSFLHLTIKVQ
jgi:hypothetical protein